MTVTAAGTSQRVSSACADFAAVFRLRVIRRATGALATPFAPIGTA
ncbi:MAG: hypothetical protein ACXVFK_09565 [Solirubrobacteraceae bacterium]